MSRKSNSLSSIEYALLGFLFSGSCHGYELHKRITDPDGIGMIWGVKLSNMYALLTKLEHQGLITGKLLPGDQRPARMEYSLTAAGKQLFEQWMFTLVNHPREFRQEFMVRMYFLSQYHPDLKLKVISDQLAECERWANATREKETALTKTGSFQNIVHHFRLSQIQSMVDWLKWLLTQNKKTSHRGEM